MVNKEIHQQLTASTYDLLVWLACDDPEGQLGLSIGAKGWFLFLQSAIHCRVERSNLVCVPSQLSATNGSGATGEAFRLEA